MRYSRRLLITGLNTVSASPLEPSSSDTLIAPSLVSSSSTVQETANGVPQVSTPINEKGKDRTKSTSHIARFSSPSSKSRQYSKLKAVFHSRSKSKSGQSTVDTSSMLATQDTDVDRNDDTRKASDSSTKKFRWPIAIIPAVDAGTGPTEHPESPTAGLKFQPKQSPPQLPKTYSAASATASSQPQPPPPKAPSTASATAPSARGPPPAPSASANNPRDMYDAKEQSDSAVFRSPNPMSAVSGYSTSTTSDLADVPSRLLYYSPGYSPGYSYC